MPRGGRCPHHALGRGACRYRGSSRARWFRRPRGSGRSPRPARWRAPRRGRRSDRGEGSGRGKFARSQYRLAVEGEMIRRPVMCLVIVPWLAVAPLVALAQRLERTPENPTREQVEAQLRYQTGRVTLSRGLATLDLSADFRYLDPQEADLVLRAWGNPPGRETLGMLVLVGVHVLTPEGWGVIISFSEDGYIKETTTRRRSTTVSSSGPCSRRLAKRIPSARRPGTPPWSSLGGPSPRATTAWPTSSTGRRTSSSPTTRRTRSTTTSAYWADAGSSC